MSVTLDVRSPPLRTRLSAEGGPVLRAADDLVSRDGPEGRDAEHAEVLVRYLYLGDDLIAVGHDPQYPDRPALRVLAVQRDVVGPARDPLGTGWPVDDRVVGDEFRGCCPVPGLDPVP